MLAMNNTFPAGTRVYFQAAAGNVKYGTVQSTTVLADGTQMAVIQPDGGGASVRLPVATLTHTG